MSTVALQRPRLLFFGIGDQLVNYASVGQANLGVDDAGGAYVARAITNAFVPAQPSHEVLCFASYILVGHQLDTPITVTVSLYCDDQTPLTATFAIPASTDKLDSRFEIGWVQFAQLGLSRVAQVPRGYRIRVGLELPAPAAGFLSIDGVECEFEIRAESIAPANAS